MLVATKGKLAAVEKKKVNKNTYDVSSVKSVTRKLLEVSRSCHAKQRQRSVTK